MTDKPTGVFVRLPLDEAQIMKLYNPKKSGNENLIALGTPVTGCDVEVVAYDNIASGYLSRVEPCTPSVNLVRQTDHIAKLAERDAEIARLREYYEANEAFEATPYWALNDSIRNRLKTARKALKGPET